MIFCYLLFSWRPHIGGASYAPCTSLFAILHLRGRGQRATRGTFIPIFISTELEPSFQHSRLVAAYHRRQTIATPCPTAARTNIIDAQRINCTRLHPVFSSLVYAHPRIITCIIHSSEIFLPVFEHPALRVTHFGSVLHVIMTRNCFGFGMATSNINWSEGARGSRVGCDVSSASKFTRSRCIL